MNLIDLLVSRWRLSLLVAALLSLSGVLALGSIPRQEDPSLPTRYGYIVTAWPGATAPDVERLIVDPIEDELAAIDAIRDIRTTARAGVAVTHLYLEETVHDVDPVWSRISDALDSASARLPPGAIDPDFHHDSFATEALVLVVTGSSDLLALRRATDELEERLRRLPDVSRVAITGDPGEQISVDFDPVALVQLGTDLPSIAGLLASRNVTVPGGTVGVGGRSMTIEPGGELLSTGELARTPISLPSGAAIELGDVATIRRTAADPADALARWNGEPAIALGVVLRDGLNVVEAGARVRDAVERWATDLAPVRVEWLAYQPEVVERRLSGLFSSLLQSMLVVALVLLLFMGARTGLTVAAVIPVVVLISLAFYAMAGGRLHQMSIAALVLALGMLVDNAIVVVEDIQTRLDAGERASDAARNAVRALAAPLASSVGTTVAAFVPMLLSRGATADFTRAIPIVVIVSLTVSYLVAIFVTPPVAAAVLRPRRLREFARRGRVTAWIGRLGATHPWSVTVALLGLVCGSAALAPRVRAEFFPGADRDLHVVDLTMPEGTDIRETSSIARRIEAALLEREGVSAVASFVGSGAPFLYYNLMPMPRAPHVAQIIVATTGPAATEASVEWTRGWLAAELPGVEAVAREILQGPPVAAPIEIRLSGDGLEELAEAADRIVAIARETPGAVDVRHTMGVGAPALRFRIDDAATGRLGLGRRDVAIALLGHTHGLPAGEVRDSGQSVPVLVRGALDSRVAPELLASIPVVALDGTPVPLDALATGEVAWRPASIDHFNLRRQVRVLAELEAGSTFSDVYRQLAPRVDALDLPGDIDVSWGGEVRSSGEANSAILAALPLGLLLLLACLLIEFNSFRQTGIVLATIPLAAVGVIPGLLVADQPFGFMSMLGVIALIGIVVNNAIVMLDLVATLRNEGATVAEALEESVMRRIRPILLTTGTTVVGLLPLLLSNSTMWPPLASALVSGLIASTALTLFAVPALYRLAFRERRPPAALAERLVPGGLATLLLVLPASAHAQTLTLDEARDELMTSAPLLDRAEQALEAVRSGTALARALYLPSIDVLGQYTLHDDERSLHVGNPYAPLAPWLESVHGSDPETPDPSGLLNAPGEEYALLPRHDVRARVTVRQPLFQPVACPLMHRAELSVDRAEVGVEEVEVALGRTLDALYMQAVGAQRGLLLATGHATLATEEVDRAQRLLAAGVGTEFEVDRARVEQARAVREIELARADYESAVLAIATLIGRDADFDVVEPEALSLPAEGSIDEWVSDALTLRPEMAGTWLDLAITSSIGDEARAGRLPGIVLRGDGEAQRESAFGGDSLAWQIQVVATWNLWDGGARRARIRENEATLGAVEATIEEMRARIEGEVRQAWIRVISSSGAVDLARNELELARVTYRHAREAREAGVGTQHEIIAAGDAPYLAELSLAASELGFQAALRELRWAMGATLPA